MSMRDSDTRDVKAVGVKDYLGQHVNPARSNTRLVGKQKKKVVKGRKVWWVALYLFKRKAQVG